VRPPGTGKSFLSVALVGSVQVRLGVPKARAMEPPKPAPGPEAERKTADAPGPARASAAAADPNQQARRKGLLVAGGLVLAAMQIARASSQM
jgi:hypothetical protein